MSRHNAPSDIAVDKMPPASANKRAWVLLALVIITVAAIRIPVLGVPLERDEGEYAYAGQLILQGIPPYKLAYNMKLPGIYAVYAVVMALFGQTPAGIHLGLLIVNAATIVLVFVLARRLFDATAAAGAAAVFAVLSVSTTVYGFFANSEHFVILPAVAGAVILAGRCPLRWGAIALSGLLFGLAFVTKQHGAAFALFGGFFLLYTQLRQRPLQFGLIAARLLLFAAAALLPFLLTCLILLKAGVFDKFWLWTFKYAQSYVSIVPLSLAPAMLRNAFYPISQSAVLPWAMVGIGLVLLFVTKRDWQKRVFVAGFLLFAFIGVCPGFYFREHYFILLLPAASLPAGLAFGYICNRLTDGRPRIEAVVLPVLLLSIIVGVTCWQQRQILFCRDVNRLSRLSYGTNPFAESPEIARYIREHSQPDDSVAVLGSEPQIYFYANRRAATGYIYTYALMEPQPYALAMQQEMIREVESARPKFIVLVKVQASWLARPESNQLILDWLKDYQARHYKTVGLFDITMSGSKAVWGAPVAVYHPTSEYWVAVLERKN